MDKKRIENKAHGLHTALWSGRAEHWPDGPPSDLVEMLDPKYAARALGLDYQLSENLGRFGHKGAPFEVAGLLNRQEKTIAVSTRFKFTTLRFTAAHEIGHWLLHPNEVMHRDRPIDGLTTFRRERDTLEKEADYFAACYLMPKKLLKNIFREIFRTPTQLYIDDNTAFFLGNGDPHTLLSSTTDSLDIALAVASCTSYGGHHHISIANRFKVSPTSMAIRLNELNLISR